MYCSKKFKMSKSRHKVIGSVGGVLEEEKQKNRTVW
jgi:hypothetical protein